jgi:hypothetical protein
MVKSHRPSAGPVDRQANEKGLSDKCPLPRGARCRFVERLARFGGEWAVQEFTTDHWISVQELPRPYPM